MSGKADARSVSSGWNEPRDSVIEDGNRKRIEERKSIRVDRSTAEASRSEFDMRKAEHYTLKLIPFFESDLATTDSAEDFWWVFETATERFSDSCRLWMFAARMRGYVGERWRVNSRLSDFETLKRRFYNRFIRLTDEQLLQRLLDAKQERQELVDDWGWRVVRYCDEAELYNEPMRYQIFANGLRNERVRRFLDCVPGQSVKVACEWVVAKGFHLPEHDGDNAKEDGLKRQIRQMIITVKAAQNKIKQRMERFEKATAPDIVTLERLEKAAAPNLVPLERLKKTTAPDIVSLDRLNKTTVPDVVALERLGMDTVPDIESLERLEKDIVSLERLEKSTVPDIVHLDRLEKATALDIVSLERLEKDIGSMERLEKATAPDLVTSERSEMATAPNTVSLERLEKVMEPDLLTSERLEMDTALDIVTFERLKEDTVPDIVHLKRLNKVTVSNTESLERLETTVVADIVPAERFDKAAVPNTVSLERFGAEEKSWNAGGDTIQECFDTVVTVIPDSGTHKTRFESGVKRSTVNFVTLGRKSATGGYFRQGGGRNTGLEYCYAVENALDKESWAHIQAVPVLESWDSIPPERDKKANF